MGFCDFSISRISVLKSSVLALLVSNVTRAYGFANDFVSHELGFNEMAGSALGCVSKRFFLVSGLRRFHMSYRLKIPMVVATLAILSDDFIALCGRVLAIKGFYHFRGIKTPCEGEG